MRRASSCGSLALPAAATTLFATLGYSSKRTLRLTSVKQFLDETFAQLGLDWNKYVEIDPKYFRPAEVDLLIGDYSKAKKKLGWEPKTRFEDLTKLMVDEDLRRLQEHLAGKSKLVG